MAAVLVSHVDVVWWCSAGLKRYFYGKRMEGLLSARGLRILDAAAAAAAAGRTLTLRRWLACLHVCLVAGLKRYVCGKRMEGC
jgi:hypothetical protein